MLGLELTIAVSDTTQGEGFPYGLALPKCEVAFLLSVASTWVQMVSAAVLPSGDMITDAGPTSAVFAQHIYPLLGGIHERPQQGIRHNLIHLYWTFKST